VLTAISDALQAIGVIPTPLEERNPEDLSRDELLELARRFQVSSTLSPSSIGFHQSSRSMARRPSKTKY